MVQKGEIPSFSQEIIDSGPGNMIRLLCWGGWKTALFSLGTEVRRFDPYCFCDDNLPVLHQLEQLFDQHRKQRNTELCHTSFHSPLELLAEIERGTRYDLIFLDVLMPGQTGIDAAAEFAVQGEKFILRLSI